MVVMVDNADNADNATGSDILPCSMEEISIIVG